MDEKAKKRVELFKLSCGFYPYEKEEYTRIRYSDDADPYVVQFLKEDIDYVETTLAALCKAGGKRVENIIVSLYMDKLTQEETAAKLHLTRRQVQYELELAFKEVFVPEPVPVDHSNELL